MDGGIRPGPRLLVGGTLVIAGVIAGLIAGVIAGVLWITLQARHRGRPVVEKG